MPERLAYDEAMQLSAIRLKVQDPELKQGKVEMVSIQTNMGSLERPWGIEGGFAVVYKFRRKNGTICALRCFRVPMSSDTHFRYERIGPYFHTHAPNITAGFKYYEEAIVVKEQGKPQNQKYPVIEMDWVDGVTLVDKINELCSKRQRAALKDLAEQWISMLQIMGRARIAHGDLAGVNAMVRADGKLVLIDYDGVYIPEFAALSQVLLGQDDFQHPQMAQRKFNEHMDAFSALVIYCALSALAVKPELWDSYAKFGPDGKLLDVNMLFRRQDFLDPQQSPLFRELLQVGDAHVKRIVQELIRACQQAIDDVKFPFALIDPHYQEKLAIQTAFTSKNIEKIAATYPLLQSIKELTQEQRQHIEQAARFMQAYTGNDDNAFLATYDALQQRPYHNIFVFTPTQEQRATLIRRSNEAIESFRMALQSRSPWRLSKAYDPVLDNNARLTATEHAQLALARLLVEALRSGDDTQLLAADSALQQSPQRSFFLLTNEEKQRFAFVHQKRKALLHFRMALQSKKPGEIVAAYTAILDDSKELSQEEREQLAGAHLLVNAFTANDDEMLVAADEALQKPATKNFFMLTQQERQHLALARQRVQAVNVFLQALRSTPTDAQEILDAYDASLLDASSVVTDEQREIVVAAQKYLIMCEAVQAGIRADNDDAIRNIYKPALAQRFTGITPSEQLRIDRAMLSQALEDLLNNKEYERGLLLAHSIQKSTGQQISETLLFKLKRATLRFIREHDLSNLTIQIEERVGTNIATVSWQWPATPLIQTALLVWQSSDWPDRPSEKNWHNPEWRYIWVRRKNNVLHSSEAFQIGKGTHIYVRGYAAILDTWEQEKIWRFSEGNEPTSCAEAASSQIIWHIQ